MEKMNIKFMYSDFKKKAYYIYLKIMTNSNKSINGQ